MCRDFTSIFTDGVSRQHFLLYYRRFVDQFTDRVSFMNPLVISGELRKIPVLHDSYLLSKYRLEIGASFNLRYFTFMIFPSSFRRSF